MPVEPAFPFARHRPDLSGMFTVNEATVKAIGEGGELSGIVEFRRHFPLIADHAKAGECVRIIAGWQPWPDRPPKQRGHPELGVGLEAQSFSRSRSSRIASTARPTAVPKMAQRTSVMNWSGSLIGFVPRLPWESQDDSSLNLAASSGGRHFLVCRAST